MNNEMPDEIALGLFYAPAPMSEHFYSVIDAETKMTPVASAKYVRADKAVPEGWKLVPIDLSEEDYLYSHPIVNAGFKAWKDANEKELLVSTMLMNIYKAMLSAAPQPPTGD